MRPIEPKQRQGLQDAEGQSLYLDMGEVEYVTASGLSVLIVLRRKILNMGRRLSLCNVNPAPFAVFRVCHLVELLDVQAK